MRLYGLIEPSSLLCHAQLSPALLVLWARELCREEDMVLYCGVEWYCVWCVVLCCEALRCVALCICVCCVLRCCVVLCLLRQRQNGNAVLCNEWDYAGGQAWEVVLKSRAESTPEVTKQGRRVM